MNKMINLFVSFISQSLLLFIRILLPAKEDERLSFKHRLIVLLVFPVFFIWQCINWCGLFLDEIFFPGYKKVTVKSPVFILGIPRSGTTFLHRLLSRDDQFLTLSTWECLFAPSITQRRFFKLIATIDKPLGSPLRRLTSLVINFSSNKLDDIHSVSLDAAEEDYLLLMPVLSVLILILPFPHDRRIRDLAFFDTRVDTERKQAILDFYHSCLQRHLYAHNNAGTLLSKNAAMLSWQSELADYYPDAQFMICTRAPDEALASQLRAIQPGIDFFATDPELYEVFFISAFEHYYQLVLTIVESELQQTVKIINNHDLRHRLRTTIINLYQHFNLPVSNTFMNTLTQISQKKPPSAYKYKNPEHYSNSQAMIRLNYFYHSILISD